MKQLINIVLFAVIVFQSTSKLYILGVFYLNREYVSNNLCVNRFDAVPVCKGSCYLKAKLKRSEKQDHTFPDLKQKQIHLFCEKKLSIDGSTNFTASVMVYPDRTQSEYSSNFLTSIFRPPRLS